jgi:hypothetical protein
MWRIVLSAMAAAFGVQSRKNLEQDERSQSILPYVLAGIIFTALFITVLVTVVRFVLSSV